MFLLLFQLLLHLLPCFSSSCCVFVCVCLFFSPPLFSLATSSLLWQNFCLVGTISLPVINAGDYLADPFLFQFRSFPDRLFLFVHSNRCWACFISFSKSSWHFSFYWFFVSIHRVFDQINQTEKKHCSFRDDFLLNLNQVFIFAFLKTVTIDQLFFDFCSSFKTAVWWQFWWRWLVFVAVNWDEWGSCVLSSTFTYSFAFFS